MNVSRPGPALVLALGVVAGCAALAPAASAEERAIDLVSGSGAATNANFAGASADGTRVFFTTPENIAGDTDGFSDTFQLLDGTTTQLTGNNAVGGVNVGMDGSSSDGTRVFFYSEENIPGTGDTDLLGDIFQAQGGVITLLSGNNPAGTGGGYAFFKGASSDGTRVFFSTTENIPGTGDTDNLEDYYQAQGGVITLLTGNNAAGEGVSVFDGSSSDGTRVFFETTEAIPTTGDGDTEYDVYKAEGGAITLATPGTSGAPNFDSISSDGSRVLFDTDENLAAPDVDNLDDIYQAQGGVLTLLTGNNAAGAGVNYRGASSDGTRVFFSTTENIGDADGLVDIYQGQGGVLTLLTPGTSGTPNFKGASSDGTRVFFETNENVAGTGDVDAPLTDIYQAQGGGITLLTGSNPTGSGGFGAFFERASSDGTRVFYETIENVPGSPDGDGLQDVYEAQAGAKTLLSGSNLGGTAAGFSSNSDDGTRVFFQTNENIPGSGDSDGAQDVYQSRVLPPVVTPTPAAAGPTGQRAAALAKCKKKRKKLDWSAKRYRTCKKKANQLPL